MLRHKTINEKSRIILTVIIASLGIIMLRLTYVQIIKGPNFLAMGQRNFLRTEKIASPRGEILDAYGKLLVTNRPITSLYWYGTGKKELSEEQQALLTTLQQITGQSFEGQVNHIKRAEKLCKKYLLMEELSFEQLSKIMERIPEDPNLSITTTFKRFYPHGPSACHMLGYLSSFNQDMQGTIGLEKIFDELLKGTPGVLLRTINSFGRHIDEKELEEALRGADLRTTIDLDLQMLVEEILPHNVVGSFIIMNPQSGALRAVASRPSFDPNIFLRPIDHEEWQKLQLNRPFLNRAFNASYPPASLFKLITTAAALENNIVNTEQTWFCPGYATFAGRRYYCNNHRGHGTLNLRNGLAKSCNIPFFDIARTIKIDTLADYAQRFGLGSTTTSILPEKSGLVPSSRWKRENLGEQWWPGETLSAAIGQSFLLITPIQAARMISALCEGFLVKPRILLDEPIEQQPLNVSDQTLQFLRRSMKAVITDGSARRLNRFRSLTIHAKTGTAQVKTRVSEDPDQEEAGPLPHAWLAAHINDEESEPLTLVIFLEHAGSSSVPTALMFSFLDRYVKLPERE